MLLRNIFTVMLRQLSYAIKSKLKEPKAPYSWSPPTIPLCQTMDQLDQYEKLDYLFTYMRPKEILNDFGCRKPCTFKVCESLL